MARRGKRTGRRTGRPPKGTESARDLKPVEKPRSASKPTALLSGEDAELWARYAQHLNPLDRRRSDALAGAREAAEDLTRKLAAQPPTDTRSVAEPGRAPPTPPKSEALPLQSPAPAKLDRRLTQKLARGAVRIEARIDLHGLFQGQAHDRLLAFLRAEQAAGSRTVLVITGKGRGSGRGSLGRQDDRAPPIGETPGVLRHAVPRWFAQSAFRDLVVGFASAHRRHGGEGALYVHLRRRKSD